MTAEEDNFDINNFDISNLCDKIPRRVCRNLSDQEKHALKLKLERMAKTGEATEDELKQVCNRLTLEKLDPKKCYLRPRKCRLLKQWDDGERRAMKDLSDNSDYSTSPIPPPPLSIGAAVWTYLTSFRGPSLHSAASVPPAPASGTAHVSAGHTFRGPSLHSAASVPPAPASAIGLAGSSDSTIHALKIGKGTLSESTPLSGPKESGIGKGGSKGGSKRCSTKNTAKSGSVSGSGLLVDAGVCAAVSFIVGFVSQSLRIWGSTWQNEIYRQRMIKFVDYLETALTLAGAVTVVAVIGLALFSNPAIIGVTLAAIVIDALASVLGNQTGKWLANLLFGPPRENEVPVVPVFDEPDDDGLGYVRTGLCIACNENRATIAYLHTVDGNSRRAHAHFSYCAECYNHYNDLNMINSGECWCKTKAQRLYEVPENEHVEEGVDPDPPRGDCLRTGLCIECGRTANTIHINHADDAVLHLCGQCQEEVGAHRNMWKIHGTGFDEDA